MSRAPSAKRPAPCDRRRRKLEKLVEFLADLTKKRFFGRIEITMRDGHIECIEKHECLKPDNL